MVETGHVTTCSPLIGWTGTSATATSSPPSPCSAASTSTHPRAGPCTRSVCFPLLTGLINFVKVKFSVKNILDRNKKPINKYLTPPQIVTDMANDNAYWAEKFLEAWQIMTTNGDRAADGSISLTPGPQSAWFGHYSLYKQGINPADLEDYIASMAPLTWTDPTV